MMAKIAIIKLWIANSFLLGIMVAVQDVVEAITGVIPHILIYLMIILLTLPEFGFLFRSYRKSVWCEAEKTGGVYSFIIKKWIPSLGFRFIMFSYLFDTLHPFSVETDILWAVVAITTGMNVPDLLTKLKK